MSEGQIFSSKRNFSAGQLNSSMVAHKSEGAYEFGARKIFNMVVTPDAIVTRRPPTLWCPLCLDLFAPSIIIPFCVTDILSFLCIFYFKENELFLEIYSANTFEKVFPIHADPNVIEIANTRYVYQVGNREYGINYSIKDLSYTSLGNYLYFSAGIYCNANLKKADFVYRLCYNAKEHAKNLSDEQIKNKWQKVFRLNPSVIQNEKQIPLITAHVVTKAFNRVWAIGAKSYLTLNMIHARLKKISEEKNEINQKLSDINSALSHANTLEAQGTDIGVSINLGDRKRDLLKNIEFYNKKISELTSEEEIANKPNWYDQTEENLKFNSILVGEKGSNQLYIHKKYKTDKELIEEFNDPLSGFSIDINLGLPGKILWAINSLDSLYIGTHFGISIIRENKDKKKDGYVNITQSVQIGASEIRPCLLDQMVCFVGQDKRSIYAIIPNTNQNYKNKVINLTISASEIFYSDIKQIISTTQPVQMLVAIKVDGTFAMYTYQADLQVAAWTSHKLGGKGHILSACSMFNKKALGDVIYFSVLRHKKRSKDAAMKLKYERSKKTCALAKKQREDLDKTRTISNMELVISEAKNMYSETFQNFSQATSSNEMPKQLIQEASKTEENLFSLNGDEYFRYILDEGNLIDQLTSKPYNQWLCIMPELKKVVDANKTHYKEEYFDKLFEILSKNKLDKEDVQNLVICEIKNEINYKKDEAEYFLIKTIRAFSYGNDINWKDELTNARTAHKR